MFTETMKLSDINPAKYNPRVELRDGDEEYEALKNSLSRFKQVVPLIVNKRTGTLISGHQRLNVMKAMGAEEAEVVTVDLDEEDEKLLNISLNKLEGDWDYEKLIALFRDIDKEDIKFTGFSEDAVSRMLEAQMTELDFEKESDEEASKTAPEDGEAEYIDDEPQFKVFLSFPTKERAEEWMKAHGIEKEYTHGRNITIRMEGLEYGQDD